MFRKTDGGTTIIQNINSGNWREPVFTFQLLPENPDDQEIRLVMDDGTGRVVICIWYQEDDEWYQLPTYTVHTCSGDARGTYPEITIVALQGIPVRDQAPTDDQVLAYDSASGEWRPKDADEITTILDLVANLQSQIDSILDILDGGIL
jgi:hypothetical protein